MEDNKSINIPKDAQPPNNEQPLNTPLIDETNVPALLFLFRVWRHQPFT